MSLKSEIAGEFAEIYKDVISELDGTTMSILPKGAASATTVKIGIESKGKSKAESPDGMLMEATEIIAMYPIQSSITPTAGDKATISSVDYEIITSDDVSAGEGQLFRLTMHAWKELYWGKR